MDTIIHDRGRMKEWAPQARYYGKLWGAPPSNFLSTPENSMFREMPSVSQTCPTGFIRTVFLPAQASFWEISWNQPQFRSRNLAPILASSAVQWASRFPDSSPITSCLQNIIYHHQIESREAPPGGAQNKRWPSFNLANRKVKGLDRGWRL